MQSKREILQKALENINHPLSEITRRTTYLGHSPGVKPTTGIKLNLPKTSTMAAKMERVLADKSPEGRKRMKQMNNLVIGREEDGDKISLEFKTASSRERFRKMMNELSENVEIDETVKIMFKGFGKEVTDFQQKLKKFGQAADYRIMMQNFKNHSNVGDGLYFTDTSKGLGFEIHSVRDRMMGDKIRKLGDSQDLGGGKTVTLIAIKEDVQLDEGSEIEFKFSNPMKAGAFMRRIMRDKLASEVDRYDGDRSPEEIVQVIMHPNDYERNDIERLAKQYKGQLRETNFRFPQPGEDYGDLTKSISDDPYYTMSKAELRKRSRDIERKFASVMRKHRGTKVGEVLDLLAKDGERKVHEDSDIKLIKRYLTKFKDNVRKVAHQMMIDFMEGDDYLAKKRIPVREDVQLESLKMSLDERQKMTYVIDRSTKKVVHGPTDVADAKNYMKKQIQPRKFMIRDIRGAAKKVGDTV